VERDRPQELSASALLRAAGAVAARPVLWWTALRQLFRLARPGWWRSWPPVPTPDRAYAHFRMVTQYGGDGASATAEDVVQYLLWCREMRRS
jgi:hypothetical protein